MRRTRQPHRPAFSIVETVFSMLLVSGVVVAALGSVGAATTGRKHTDGRGRGQLLAESLMTEILAQAYQDSDGLQTFGLESGEAATDRKYFDDVDDYRAYTDSPPRLHDGTEIPGLSGWSRVVSVQRSDPLSPNSIPTTESGLKRIKVTVKCNNMTVATLTGFKTNTDPVAGKSSGVLTKVIVGLDTVLEPASVVGGIGIN